jgi:DNA-binding CsgD family transcriptional regulator
MALNATAVLDRLPHGVLLVSKTGAVLSTNRAADEILRVRDGLTSDGGELRASTIPLTNRLRAAVLAASRTGAGVAIEGGDPSLILPRPSGRPPLSVTIAPLPARRAEIAADSATAIIFVSDPDRSSIPDIAAFRSMFGLTPAESELVRRLAAGLSLEDSAAELEVRLDTVRSRLKIVFQKTNTHRQADLVRLVLTTATPAFHT